MEEYTDIQMLNKSGKAYPGTQIKIFNPDEQGVGEICLRGRHIFMGYLDNPQSTMEAFDTEGYFKTGDIGLIDKKGDLEITGREKEIIITAGGENVSPIKIEEDIKEKCKIVNHAIVIGDERKYLSCILTIKPKID